MSEYKNIKIIIILLSIMLFFGQAFASEFSADLILVNPGDSTTAKLYVRDNIYRLENLDGEQQYYAIENRLEDNTTVVNTVDKTFKNLKGPSGAFFNPIKGWEYMTKKSDEKNIGAETVNGFECDHYTYSYAGSTTPHTELWQSKKLGFFVKYVVHYDGDKGDGYMELSNVVEGPQDDALFVVPDGYSREKTPDEIELERPAISTTSSATAPVARRMVSGGELIVKVDPTLSVRFEITNLIKDSSVCHVSLYKKGEKIDLKANSIMLEDSFTLTYNGERKRQMSGMQNEVDEVRIKIYKGRVMALVFNEFSSFDDDKREQFFVFYPGRGVCGWEEHAVRVTLTGDSYASGKSAIKVHAYEQVFVDGLEQKNTIEEIEFELKNGEEKILNYPAHSSSVCVNISINDGGGAKMIFSQPE